jgi:opacity protein-like surface antigen
MKRLLITATLLAALAAPAQAQQNISPEMLKMMQDMHSMSPAEQKAAMTKLYTQTRKADECFKKIDPALLHALEAEGDAMQAEIKKLCAANRRDDAQRYALKEGERLAAQPVMQDLKTCSEEMAKQYQMQGAGDGSSAPQHVCDSGGM